MSQPFKVPVNSIDALERFSKRNKVWKKHQGQLSSRPVSKGQGLGLLPQAYKGVGNAHQQKRGRLDAMTSSFEDDSVSLTFPFSALVLSNPSLLIDQVDRLLLSEDASRFQEMGVVVTRKNCFRETY